MKNWQNVIKGKFGMGTAPLGNMFKDVPDEQAYETIETAWNEGVRYFDTAPLYGAGLAELRLGKVLSQYSRNDYLLSTKVGRVILDETEEKEGLYADGRKNKVVTNYTEDATKRSIEQSLKRLQTDRIDFVYVHDLSPDYFGDEWVAKFDEARKGAFHVLDQLQDEGVIGGWGLGVNTTIPIELALSMEDVNPSISLSATQYTLLQHEQALQSMMPRAVDNNMGIVVGAPFSSGALLGGDHFNYEKVPPNVKSKIKQLTEIANHHDVSLSAAALQFATAHPAVAAVIPGSTHPNRIKEDIHAMEEKIPEAFWKDLIEKKLISSRAPLPAK
ncbi:aldo/keto reductase [Aciduricibacillus chroicocephali]|uniref:Aldo/keto reductase n=1 Tax=Aciduricibacillus chroicocephali TaxID=3054939 RepID=A0ABY9KVJ9_9BACI|nr:aldo/keto reductase [Bacillaceae bacterium 44XB]